ncbi:hypothetical protein Tco_1244083 [Tanacetum coccineum]
MPENSKKVNGANDKEYDYEDKMNNSGTRVIEVVDENIKFDLMGRSIAGEVKEIEYLEKLSQICEEEGCFNAEVNIWVVLEVTKYYSKNSIGYSLKDTNEAKTNKTEIENI